MKSVRTNKVKIELYYQSIIDDFIVYRFSSSESYISNGSLFLDEMRDACRAKSVVFETGRVFYALFDKEEIKTFDIRRELNSFPSASVLSFEKIDSLVSLKSVPKHLLSQLLLNSLTSPKHESLRFNNLAGKLILFDKDLFELSTKKDSEQILKIIALEFRLDSDSCLNLNVRTFSSLIIKAKLGLSANAIGKMAKYTLSYSTMSLRRILPSKKVELENTFVLKQENSKKSSIPFLTFDNLENFRSSKIGLLTVLFEMVKSKLSRYLSIDFEDKIISNSCRFEEKLNGTDVDGYLNDKRIKIRILDEINDDDSAIRITELINHLKLKCPQSDIRFVNQISKTSFNIKLIHNEAYYQKYKLKDEYNETIRNIQHVTIEDFKIDSTACLNSLLKEIAVKIEIGASELSLINWSRYKYDNSWVFGNKNGDSYYYLIIAPDGKMKFERLESTLFNQDEFGYLNDIFENDIDVEGIVKNDKGDINIIRRTNRFTIPKYEWFYDQLRLESIQHSFSKLELLQIMDSLSVDNDNFKLIHGIINNSTIDFFTKKDLLELVNNRSDKKTLSEFIYKQHGVLLKTYFRDKSRYDFLDSNLDIHSYEEGDKLYYYVGVKGKGIKTEIPRASVIREICGYNSSAVFFDDLLKLMSVDFVRHGDLTVLPFPFKYLREYAKLA